MTPPDEPQTTGSFHDRAEQQPATPADHAVQTARGAYLQSVKDAAPMSRSQIARQFGGTRTWARDHVQNQASSNRQSRPDTTPATDQARKGQPRHAKPVAPAVGRPRSRRSGKGIAWLAFGVGVAASVAANVMHARIVSGTSAAWAGAAFWPIALLLALEVLTRVDWPTRSRWYGLARYGGTALVATVAAILSYRHMAGLLTAWGEDPINAYLGPLAVDGLMITAAAALLAHDKPRARSR